MMGSLKYLLTAAPLLLSAMPAPAQQSRLEPGLGGGVFSFLNGTTGGAIVDATVRGPGAAAFVASAWISSPEGLAVGIDVGPLLRFPGSGPSPFLRAGAGFLFSSELTGPGIHLGVGFEAPPVRGPGVRLEAAYHGYTPGGGVPLLRATVSVLLPGGRPSGSAAAGG